MADNLAGPLRIAAVVLTTAFVLASCSSPDRRLTEDQQSCSSMGHPPGTSAFQQCMHDLNQRRCAETSSRYGGESHEASMACSRL